MNCLEVQAFKTWFWQSKTIFNLEQGSCQVGDDKEEGGDGVSGLQQRDCEREQEMAWDHQEQQDPEEEKMF